MKGSVSSSESSDDTGVRDFKAAQAAQFSKLNGTSNPLKFKEAQAEGFRVDPIRQTPPRKPRSSSIDQTPTARARPTTQQQSQRPTSATQLLHLLATDNKETKETRKLLHSALAQLDASSRRLAQSDAERRALELSQLARTTQTLATASVVQQNAAAAQAQLSLYELRLKTAEAEIERAQSVVRALEVQRDDAEEHAARARSLARKLQVEHRTHVAREQGRREGYDQGVERGQMVKAAKEQRRREREQGRIEADIRRRQIQMQMAPPVPASTREPGSAFIEEHFSEAENEGGRTAPVSRAMSSARQSVPPQQEAPQRRATLDSVRSAPRQQQRSPEAPPPATSVEPQAAPVVNNTQPPPQRERAASVASSRRASDPPAAPPPQQAPRPPITSIDFGAASRPRAATVNSRPGGSTVPSMASTSRSSVAVDPTLNANVNSNRNSASATSQRTRRNSAVNRTSAGAAAAATAPAHRRTASAASASTSTLNVNDELGIGRAPRQMTLEGMIRNIPMPPPPTGAPVTMPEPIVMPQHVPMPPPPPGVSVSMPVPPVQHQQPQFEVERPGAERREARPQSPSSVSGSLATLRLTSFPTVGGGSGPGSERDFPAGAGRDRERELSTIIEHATGESQQLGTGSGWDTVRQQTPWTRRSSPYSDPRGMEEWRRETDEEAVRPPPTPVTSPGMLSPYDPIRQPQNSNMQRPSQESFQSNLQRSSSGSSSRTVNITIVPPSRPASITQANLPAQGSGHLSPNQVAVPVVLEEDEDEEDDDDDDDESEDAPMPPGFVMGPLPAFAQGVSTLPPGFVPVSVAPSAGNAQTQPQVARGAGSSWGAPPPAGQPTQPASRPGMHNTSNAAWYAPPVIGANPTEPVHPPGYQGMLGNPANPATAWTAPPITGVAPTYPSRPPSRQMGGTGMLGNPANAARAAPPLTVEPVTRPSSRLGHQAGAFTVESAHSSNRQMGGIPGNPASGFTVEPARPPSRQGNPANTWGAAPGVGPPQQSSGPPGQMGGAPGANWGLGGQYAFGQTPGTQAPQPLSMGNPASGFMVEHTRPPSRLGNSASTFTVEPARPPSRQMSGNPASGFIVEPAARPPSRLGNPTGMEPARPPSRQMGGVPGNPNSGFVVEPARPLSRQGMVGNPSNAWGVPPVMGANAMGPQHPSGPPGHMGAAPGANWAAGGQYTYGQTSTPAHQPPQSLGFPGPSVGNAGVVPHSPLPTRPQAFTGADNRSTTPRPLYGPPAGNATFGAGYGAPAPGVAAGYPLPTSRSNSTATTTPHQRIANLNAGTTPAAFNARALSSPASRASSGFGRRNNQTPNPNANLGITNPYTSMAEEGSPGSDSSNSSLGLARMNSFDRVTANNTLANAGIRPVIPPSVVPPSPAHSYRPMR